jgi:hypothetical protein
MSKVFIVDNCTKCPHYQAQPLTDNYGEFNGHYIFICTKTVPQSIIDKKFVINKDFLIEIPEWCLLEDRQGE